MKKNTTNNGLRDIGQGKPSISLHDSTRLDVFDIQLWQELKKGSEDAFATIYSENVHRLYSYGLKLVTDKSLVKDCIQDLFVEIWDSKHRLGEVKSIKSYLYKSIRRKLIAEASKQRNRYDRSAVLRVVGNTTHSPEINLIELQSLEEDKNKLMQILKKLNKKQREIIHLKFYVNLSYDEISEIMSLDKKSTYNLMAHTIKLLRQYVVVISITLILIF